jgi:hypothetical protein
MREFVVRDWKQDGPLSLGHDRPAEEVTPKEPSALTPVIVGDWDSSGVAPDAAEPAAGQEQEQVVTLPEPRVARRPAATTKRRPAPRSDSPRRRGMPKRRDRNFVVAYGGTFLGLVEADSDITPREAYLRAAQEVAAWQEDFRPELLQLYKPVLLRSARPSKSCSVVPGRLELFASKSAPPGKKV